MCTTLGNSVSWIGRPCTDLEALSIQTLLFYSEIGKSLFPPQVTCSQMMLMLTSITHDIS